MIDAINAIQNVDRQTAPGTTFESVDMASIRTFQELQHPLELAENSRVQYRSSSPDGSISDSKSWSRAGLGFMLLDPRLCGSDGEVLAQDLKLKMSWNRK
jgi:hypothetical protein